MRYVTAPDGTHHLVCQGDQRFQVVEFLSGWPFLVARVQRLTEPQVGSSEIEARFLNLQRQAVEALQLLPQTPQELLAAIQNVQSPSELADLTAAYLEHYATDADEPVGIIFAVTFAAVAISTGSLFVVLNRAAATGLEFVLAFASVALGWLAERIFHRSAVG